MFLVNGSYDCCCCCVCCASPRSLSPYVCVCVLVLINIAPSSHSVPSVCWSWCWSAQLAKQPRAVHIYKFLGDPAPVVPGGPLLAAMMNRLSLAISFSHTISSLYHMMIILVAGGPFIAYCCCDDQSINIDPWNPWEPLLVLMEDDLPAGEIPHSTVNSGRDQRRRHTRTLTRTDWKREFTRRIHKTSGTALGGYWSLSVPSKWVLWHGLTSLCVGGWVSDPLQRARFVGLTRGCATFGQVVKSIDARKIIFILHCVICLFEFALKIGS